MSGIAHQSVITSRNIKHIFIDLSVSGGGIICKQTTHNGRQLSAQIVAYFICSTVGCGMLTYSMHCGAKFINGIDTIHKWNETDVRGFAYDVMFCR